MANVVRYVNTASSGGDGTTNNTSGATAAYASLSAWNTGQANNLVTNGNTHTVYCSGTAADTGGVALSGWTTDSTHFITFIGEQSTGYPSATPTGKYDTNKFRIEYTSAGGFAMDLTNAYCVVKGIQIKLTANNQANVRGILDRGGNATIRECLIKGVLSGTTTAQGVEAFGGNITLYNCILYDWVNGANVCKGFYNDANTATLDNVTVQNCYNGIQHNLTTTIAKNCLAYNCTNAGYVGAFSASSTNNLDGPTGSTAPGSNAKNATTVSFVDEANDDFHLQSSDTGAKDNGTDLSVTFTIDIDGSTRTGTWDIGADEYIATVSDTNRTPAVGSASATGTQGILGLGLIPGTMIAGT